MSDDMNEEEIRTFLTHFFNTPDESKTEMFFNFQTSPNFPLVCFNILISNDLPFPIRFNACVQLNYIIKSSKNLPEKLTYLFNSLSISFFASNLSDPTTHFELKNQLIMLLILLYDKRFFVIEFQDLIFFLLSNDDFEIKNLALSIITESHILCNNVIPTITIKNLGLVFSLFGTTLTSAALNSLNNSNSSMFAEQIAKVLVPFLHDHINDMDEESVFYSVCVCKRIMYNLKDWNFVQLFIILLDYPSERVVIRSAKSFHNSLMPFKPECIIAIYSRLSTNETLFEYNISLQLMRTLKQLVFTHPNESFSLILPQINLDIQSQDVSIIRRGLRGLSIIFSYPQIEKVEEYVSICVSFLQTPNENTFDALYCLSKIAKRHINYLPNVIDVLFKAIQNDNPIIRRTCYHCLKYTLKKAINLPPEPFLSIILSIFSCNPEPEEMMELASTILLFVNSVSSFEGIDSFLALLNIIFSHISETSIQDFELCHWVSIIASIPEKAPSQIERILSNIGIKILQIISFAEEKEDPRLVGEALKFSANAIRYSCSGTHPYDISSYLAEVLKYIQMILNYRGDSESFIKSMVFEVMASVFAIEHPFRMDLFPLALNCLFYSYQIEECFIILAHQMVMLNEILEKPPVELDPPLLDPLYEIIKKVFKTAEMSQDYCSRDPEQAMLCPVAFKIIQNKMDVDPAIINQLEYIVFDMEPLNKNKKMYIEILTAFLKMQPPDKYDKFFLNQLANISREV